MAAKAGATYVSPFVGRLDDISSDGIELVEKIVDMYAYYGLTRKYWPLQFATHNISFNVLRLGADVATCPLSAIKGLLKHPLTDSGLATFWLITRK